MRVHQKVIIECKRTEDFLKNFFKIGWKFHFCDKNKGSFVKLVGNFKEVLMIRSNCQRYSNLNSTTFCSSNLIVSIIIMQRQNVQICFFTKMEKNKNCVQNTFFAKFNTAHKTKCRLFVSWIRNSLISLSAIPSKTKYQLKLYPSCIGPSRSLIRVAVLYKKSSHGSRFWWIE